MGRIFRATVSDSQLRSWRCQGISYECIMRATGMTTSELSRRLHTLYRYKNPDPSLEEIELACAEIQRGWSDQEREQRCVTRNGEWTATVVPTSVLACANAWLDG